MRKIKDNIGGLILVMFFISTTGVVTAETIQEKVMEHRSVFINFLSPAWNNPSLLSLHYNSSLSTVEVAGDFASGYRGGRFNSSTYQKNKVSTITGNISYENGKRLNGQLTETSDVETVGPYMLFANGPGDLRCEKYDFGGSYTSVLRNWHIGIAGNYQASLAYRTMDPRPRNITGTLRINPSAAYRTGNRYITSLGFVYVKYKQTNNIKFVSELGQNTLYHLTGLGCTYGRFDGTGSSTYYTGSSYGVQAGLMPTNRGAYALTEFSNMKITNILTDLNKLPMAKTATLDWTFSAGWRDSNLIVGLEGRYCRRRGFENIFGDAVSGQYPQIGSLALYSRTQRNFCLSGIYRHDGFQLSLHSGWESHFEQHLSSLRTLEWQRIKNRVTYQQQILLHRGGYLGVVARIESSIPVRNSISGIQTSNQELQNVIRNIEQSYKYNTTRKLYGGTEINAMFPIKTKFMVGCAVSYSRTIESTNIWNTSIQFTF